MEKREQRIRRDRRRDGKRNTFQNEQGRETIKQQDASVEKKKNDTQNVEVSNKNTSEDKDKTVEDDPLRFANLKRETDEIAALKAKKPHKRQVFSNWSKYEEPLPCQDESRAVDFETLLHAPQSGGFKFKSEQQWDTGSYGRFGELFSPDAELLVGGLTSLAFYERLCIDKMLFSADEIERMDSCAKTNYTAYEKLSKSKPKQKVAATDLFKMDQAEKYSVVDEADGQAVELGTSSSKPVFSVEESPERSPAEPSLPLHRRVSLLDAAGESAAITGSTPEAVAQDFHFGKPETSSHGAAENRRSQTPGRESTALQNGSRGEASPEFSFQRAPPRSYATSNLKSPVSDGRSTAPEVTVPVLHSGSDRQGAAREGTPDRVAPLTRGRGRIEHDDPTVAKFTSVSGGPPQDVHLRGEMSAGEQQMHEDDGSLGGTSSLQKVTDDHLEEEKNRLHKIPSKVETPEREEIPRESVLQRSAADVTEEPTHRKSYETAIASERELDVNGQVSTENDSYLKKSEKTDRKQEGQQRGGGRHGRRKKAHNTPARAAEQQRAEAGDVHGEVAEPEGEGTVQTATKTDAQEGQGREDTRPAGGAKKKPERPPPPAVLQQNRSPKPQPSSTEPVDWQTENEVPQPTAGKPEEVKPRQVEVSAAPLDSRVKLPEKTTATSAKAEPAAKERSPVGRVEDAGLDFLMSLRSHKSGGVSELEAAKSAAGVVVSRSAIEEDELRESQKPKPPPAIAAEKKEDLEDWLDSMLDD